MNIEPTFEQFWDLYDKKRCKIKAEKKWNRLKFEEKLKIIQTLPSYVKSTPNKQYRKDPCTYLNNKCWNDEIITDTAKAEAFHDNLNEVLRAGLRY